MTEWTLSLLVLWFIFGSFYGYKHAWKEMFFSIKVSRNDVSVTVSPVLVIYFVGLAAIAVS